MARADTVSLGRRAESAVRRYLQRRGLKVVAQNFRSRHGEIDLIMLDGECLAFIEVRYRGRNRRIPAVETVDARKRQRLARTAAIFLAAHDRYRSCTCRFDVVGVEHAENGKRSLRWLRDAFRPGD